MVLRTAVNILDYNGVIGNGSHDDTTGVQAAFYDVIAGANLGKMLYIPGGYKFMLSSPIFVTGVLTVQGAGYDQSIFQAFPNMNNWMFWYVPAGMLQPKLPSGRSAIGRAYVVSGNPALRNAAGRMGVSDITGGLACVFRDITINHDGANQTAGGCFYAPGAVRSVFEHIHFQNAYDAGLWMDAIVAGSIGYENHITRCTFDGGSASASNGQGIRITNSDKNSIVECSLDNLGGAGSQPYAVYDTANFTVVDKCQFSFGQEHVRLAGSKTRLTNNSFDQPGRAAIHQAAGASSAIISGNSFRGGGMAGAAGTYSIWEIEGPKNTFIGNTLETYPGQNGVLRSWYREYSSAAGPNVLQGNTFTKTGGALLNGAHPALELVAAAGTFVSNNPGYNPVGTPPVVKAMPASGVAVTNDYGSDCMVYINPNGATLSLVTIGTVLANSANITDVTGFYISAGQTIKLTYAGGTPVWSWVVN